MTHCSRCDTELHQPVEAHANYVLAEDFIEEESYTLHVGFALTDLGRDRLDDLDALLEDRTRDDIAAALAAPDAPNTIEVPDGTEIIEEEGGETETAATTEVGFFARGMFEEVAVDSPEVVKEDNAVVRVETHEATTQRQKTGLVCPSCTDADDDIIWGPDA